MQYSSFPYRLTPPVLEAISETTARKWLRLETGVTDSDTETIEMLIRSAVDSFQQRTYIKQLMQADWEWMLNCLPVNIPVEPNIQNLTIKYKAVLTDLVWTDFDITKFMFQKTGERTNSINYLIDLPSVAIVKVNFKLGFATASEIPPDYFRPIRAILSNDFDNRMDGLADKKNFSERLMEQYAHYAVR